MPVFTDNRALLDRFRAGDREALSIVYEHYVDAVAALARRGFNIGADGSYVPGAPDVQAERDIVQDVFVRAFSDRARMSFDGLRPYRPYLLRIAKNLIVDRYRARRREQRCVGVDDIDEVIERGAALVEDAPALEQDLHWRTLSAATTEFVTGLGAESRALVRHRFEHGHSQHDAAAHMGCSRRRVRTLEARVQKDLRRFLKRRGLLND